MSDKAIIFAVAALPAVCAVLICRKLFEMLSSDEPYWLRRQGYVDKAKQPFTHALYTCVFMFSLLVSLGFIWLCVWTVQHI